MAQLDFVTKDYDGFLKLMKDKIPLLCPDWTDTSDSDMGVVLLQLFSYALDVLAYYVDKAVAENDLSTAQTRRAIIRLARFLGYELSNQTPSNTFIVFTKGSQYLNTVVKIPKKTVISTDPTSGLVIYFETDADLVIPAGVLGNEKDSVSGKYLYGVTATQGKTVYNDSLYVGTGEPNQEAVLPDSNIMPDTLTLYTVEDGLSRKWNQVKDFLRSDSNSRDYKVQVDEFGSITLLFGNGLTGATLPDGVELQGVYRVGGGVEGNVGLNIINTISDVDIPEIVSLTNPEPLLIKGMNAEDSDHARQMAAKYFKTNQRAVTKYDFETICLLNNNVSKVKCVETFDEVSDLLIYIATADYTPASQSLKDELLATLQDVELICNTPAIYDVGYTDFDIEILVTTTKDYINAEIQNLVTTTLQSFLSCDNADIGETITLSSVINKVMGITGVWDVLITNPLKNISPANDTSLVRLRTLTVNVTGGVE